MPIPRLVITGASGFIGRHVLQAVQGKAHTFALARRSPAVSGAPTDPSITWRQVDVSHRGEVEQSFEAIRDAGGADVLLHLAGHYDFTGRRDPAYHSTNVLGMRHVLDAAVRVGIGRVVFASSVAACQFPAQGRALTEMSDPDGDTPYAVSKRAGETMLAEYRGSLRSVIIRFAALYSDWCEYEPLFRFLERWLARVPTRRVLAGCGHSAVPYLHIRDAIDFLLLVLANVDRFDDGGVLVASPDGSVTHRELFEAATAAHFGQRMQPVFVPKPLCRAGVVLRDLGGRAIGARPFERWWMVRMIDRRLTVDSSATRQRTGWAPRARLDVRRRMPFLVEHRKTYPAEWHRRNHASLRSVRRHDNLLIHRLLEAHARSLCSQLTDRLVNPKGPGTLARFRQFTHSELCAQHRVLIEELMTAVRTGEKGVFMEACHDLAEHWRGHGLGLEATCEALETLESLCRAALTVPQTADLHWRDALHDHLTMTFQFGVDEVHEVYERRSVNEPW